MASISPQDMHRFINSTSAQIREALADEPQEGPTIAPTDSAVSEVPTDPEGRPMKYQRHWLTGEWGWVPVVTGIFYADDGPSAAKGVKVLARRDYNRELKGLSIPPEQATPERIARENREAKRHNTGAVYDRDGRCFTSSRNSQNRELRRKGKQNNDAGYGDYAGR